MTRDQVEELSGLTQTTFQQSLDVIKQTIRDVIQAKSSQPPSQEKTQEETAADAEEVELLQQVVAQADQLSAHIVCDKQESEETASPLGTSSKRIVFEEDVEEII